MSSRTAALRGKQSVMASADPVTAAPPKPRQYARQGSKLPREVIVWLQSLSIPCPITGKPITGAVIKNPKRDLSNGAHIGGICSCYWSDVPLHSLSNQLSVDNKRSNWRVLAKLFARHDAPLSDAMIDGMIEARDAQYAEVFLLQLYSLLTGRPLHVPLAEKELALPPAVDAASLPPYHPPQIVVSAAAPTGGAGGAGGGGLGPSDANLLWKVDSHTLDVDGGAAAEPSSMESRLTGGSNRTGAGVGARTGSTALAGKRASPAIPTLPSLVRDGRSGYEAAATRNQDRGVVNSSLGPIPSLRPVGKGGEAVRINAPIGDEDVVDEDGRVKVKFDITVRAAKQSSTIVRAPPRRAADSVTTTNANGTLSGSRSTTTTPPLAGDENAKSLAERGADNVFLRAFTPMAAAAAESVVVDATICPVVAQWAFALLASAVGAEEGDSIDASHALHYFLLCQEGGERAERCRQVWNVLQTQRERLAAHARIDSTAFAQLVEVFLRVPMQLAFNYRRGMPAGEQCGWLVPAGCFQSLAALLAALSTLDSYRAAAILKSGVLYNSELMRLFVALGEEATIVEGLSSLLLAVTSVATPAAATSQVSDVLSALSEELFDSGAHPAAEASVFFLLAFRGVLMLSDVDGEGKAAPSAAAVPAAVADGSAASNAAARGRKGVTLHRENAMLLDWLQEAGRAHATRALSRADEAPEGKHRGISKTQLAAAWLAVGLLQTANCYSPAHAAAAIGELGPLLTPPVDVTRASVEEGEDTLTCVYAVVYAMWLRACTVAQRQGVSKGDAAAARETEQRVQQLCGWLDGFLSPTRALDAAAGDNPDGEDDNDENEEDNSGSSDGERALVRAATVVAFELACLIGDGWCEGRDAPSISENCVQVVSTAVIQYFTTQAPEAAVEQVMSDASFSSPYWYAPMLGPLYVTADFPQRSRPLFLTEALAHLHPAAAQEGPGNGSKKEFPPATTPAASAFQRKVGTAANSLARDGCELPSRTRLRLRWLYYINHSETPVTALPLGEREAVDKWRAVWLNFYEEVTLVVATAEVFLTRQQQRLAANSKRQSMADANELTSAQSQLLRLAALSQRVVVVWFAEYQWRLQTPMASVSSMSAGRASVGAPKEGTETSEQLTAAMEWFRSIIMPTS